MNSSFESNNYGLVMKKKIYQNRVDNELRLIAQNFLKEIKNVESVILSTE